MVVHNVNTTFVLAGWSGKQEMIKLFFFFLNKTIFTQNMVWLGCDQKAIILKYLILEFLIHRSVSEKFVVIILV